MSHKGKAYALIAPGLSLLLCGLTWANEIELVWSTLLGGDGSDGGNSIAVDDSGYAYVTGDTESPNFPTTFGAFDEIHNGGRDVFVAKLNPAGNSLAYATFLGGNNWDQGFDIAVDGSGSAYVTGSTLSSDFPTTAEAFDTTHHGKYDAFLTKLNSAGSVLAYSTFLGGSDDDRGQSIAVDIVGSAYLTGWTRSGDFPTTTGAFCTIYHGHEEEDAFVAKLNPSGSELGYATFLGGVNEDWGRDIAVDSSGNAYVGVLTYSADFPATAEAFDATYNGSREAVVAKLNPSGSALAYATFLGGSGQDWSQNLAVDGDGHVYLVGVTFSADFPTTPGAFDRSHNGLNDVFAAQINPAGSDLVYATFLGGTGEERGVAMALDGSGNAYLTGWTRSADFPTTALGSDTSYNGETDSFVAKINTKGSVLSYATFLGGSSFDGGFGIALDGSGNTYVTGRTRSGDFPTTTGALAAIHSGGDDVFVTKLDLSGYP